MEFHKVIDKFFKSQGLSSYAIAKETGFSAPTIGRWRDGTSTPTRNNWKVLFEYYPKLEELLSNRDGSSGDKTTSDPETEKISIDQDVSKILSNCPPLHILNYIHLNWNDFKDQPLIKAIQKEAVSIYKSEKEKDDIEEMVVGAIKKYLGNKIDK
jgi:hypothetical protein